MGVKFSRLTRSAIRSLQQGEKIMEHGITATRLMNGDIRYSINIMVDRQRVHRVIGRESQGATRAKAQRAIEAVRTKVREGSLDLPAGRKTSYSFGEASEEYLTRIAKHPKHGRNIERKKYHLRQRLAPHFNGQRIDNLTELSVAGYFALRLEEEAAQATINRELSTLSHFLNRCLEWGWIRKKPRIDKGSEPRKKITTLSEVEETRLIKAAMDDQDPLTWLFAVIAIGTGMRHGEILRIRWDEIDFDLRRIYVAKAKAGQREQPIPPSLAKLLKEQWELGDRPEDYIFQSAGKNAKLPYRTTMAEQFRRTVIRAGLDSSKVTPHVLRHTAITSLVKAGIDLPTIQKISGHKTMAMVLRYTQLSDTHVDGAMANLDAAIPQKVTHQLHTGGQPCGVRNFLSKKKL